ncbi:MAG: 2-polyprenylphenol 6-hydroxylase [Pseudomonadota bacterium]|nr:2-polyprenylphenol 6-hydroxylase [Pseudomonadota bacterium]
MISNLIRVIQIIYCVIKNDIDTMLLNSNLVGNKKFIFYIFPWNWFNKTEVMDGPQKIRKLFEDLGPIFVKFGQIISTRKDLLSKPIAIELSKLQDNVTPFSGNEAIKIIENDLRKNIKDVFPMFNPKPIASASIAQVHEAKLKNGKDVVIKVVRPKIVKQIQKDLLLMKRTASYLDSLSDDFKRMHLIEIVNDYEKIIFDELDLSKEAKNAARIKKNFENSSLLYIPEIYWDLTSKNILVMERVFAIPINNKDELRKKNINFEEVATKALELFFIQVFEHNFFHADMHPGNIFIRKNKNKIQFILVDFGIMGSLSEFDKKYLAENFVAFFRRDYKKVAKLHVECEWVPKDTNIYELEEAIRKNCEPMLDRPIKDISISDIIISLFDTARKFKLEVQPQLILMQKTLLYTEGLGREFFPELDLWKTSQPILEEWMKKQKGLLSLMKKFRENSSYLIDIFPEIPTSIHRIIRLVNSENFDLSKNLKQLMKIEEQIKKSRTRNYWYFSTIILLIPPVIMTALLLGFDKLYLAFNFLVPYVLIAFLLIFIFRPKG